MTDIVERLRAHYPFAGLPREAAEEIERLRAALEPFAKEADRYEPNEGDDDVRAWGSSFPIYYLRRARDALGNEKAAPKETAFPTSA